MKHRSFYGAVFSSFLCTLFFLIVFFLTLWSFYLGWEFGVCFSLVSFFQRVLRSGLGLGLAGLYDIDEGQA